MNQYSPDDDLHLENYSRIVLSLQEARYDFCTFEEACIRGGSQPFVILRHDVDFSLRGAIQVAELEKKVGVHSSFFIHLRSPLYNALSDYASQVLRSIYENGHDVGLHFDMCHYPDRSKINDYLQKEIKLLTEFYPFANDKVVSFHRVGTSAHDLRDLILPNGVIHTYQREFFQDITYFSDSGGRWRRGNPIFSDDFKFQRSMQIMTHPMWWTETGNNPYRKLESYLRGNREQTIDFLEQTVISYSLSDIRLSI